jgi:hypothetical protein
MSDGGAGPSVLAVPSVPVEEDEVRFACMVDHLIDPNQPLDRGRAPALVEWIEVDDPHDPPFWRRLRLEWPPTYATISEFPANPGLR